MNSGSSNPAFRASEPGRHRVNKPKESILWKIWREENYTFFDHTIPDALLDREDREIVEISEEPPDMLVTLKGYQMEWLAWALKQEASEHGGGILADEPGMGKTIEAIALVLAERAMPKEGSGPHEALPSLSLSEEKLLEIKATLVVCPGEVLPRWVEEIGRCTLEGSTKVLVYDGRKKKEFVDGLLNYDFVLTKYATVVAEFKKWKDLESAKGTEQRQKPSHLNTNMARSREETSNTGGEEKEAGRKGKMQCQPVQEVSLHSVKWHRIILDEAQIMRDRYSKTAEAVYALKSSYKWGLSGTFIWKTLKQICHKDLRSLAPQQAPPTMFL